MNRNGPHGLLGLKGWPIGSGTARRCGLVAVVVVMVVVVVATAAAVAVALVIIE